MKKQNKTVIGALWMLISIFPFLVIGFIVGWIYQCLTKGFKWGMKTVDMFVKNS